MSAFGIGKLGLGAAAVSSVLALAACGSSSSSGTAAGGGGSTAASQPAGGGSATTLKSKSTSIGKVLVDASGHTVYELVGDSAANPKCAGSCLAIWPPVKSNGTQMIVNGHPAYTYVGDKSPGQTKGQNLTDQWGKWLALGADGKPITSSGSAKGSSGKSKAPSGGGPAF